MGDAKTIKSQVKEALAEAAGDEPAADEARLEQGITQVREAPGDRKQRIAAHRSKAAGNPAPRRGAPRRTKR